MAVIIGLQEKKDAVRKIERLVDKVKVANNFLDNLTDMKGGFTISYSAEIKVEDGKPSATRSYRHPLIVSDIESLRRNVLYQRGIYISQIDKLCEEYSISLSDTEGSILSSYETDGSIDGGEI